MRSNLAANPFDPASLVCRDPDSPTGGLALRAEALRLPGPLHLEGRALSLFSVKDDQGRYYLELRAGGDVRRFEVRGNARTTYLSTDSWIDVTGKFIIHERAPTRRGVFIEGERPGGGNYSTRPNATLFVVHGDVYIQTWNT